jgi:hypothetical protein
MRLKTTIRTAFCVCAAAALALTFSLVSRTAPSKVNLPVGKVPLTSAGSLAFGPDGILFVADSVGAKIVAIDTHDAKPVAKASINVEGVDGKIAAMVGVPADQIVINHVVVNPISKNSYLSASRGKGPDAAPLIAKVDTAGKITLLSLDSAPNEAVSLVDAPEANSSGRQNPRMQTITDLRQWRSDGGGSLERRMEFGAAFDSVPVQVRREGRDAPNLALFAWPL